MKKIIACLLLFSIIGLFVGGCGPNMPKENPKYKGISSGTSGGSSDTSGGNQPASENKTGESEAGATESGSK